MYKSAKLILKNNTAILDLGSDFSNVEIIKSKNVNSKLGDFGNSVLLIAALWSSADRISIKLLLQVSEFYQDQNFKIKAYDKADEIKDFLYTGYSTKDLFPPKYMFVRNGKLVIEESGKIYNLASLRKRISEIYK
jgi:hypothetical protein